MNILADRPPRLICLDAAGTLFRVRGSVGAIYAEIAVAYGLPDREDLAQVLEERFRTAFPAMPAPVYRFGDRTYNDSVDREWWRLLVARVLEGLGPLSFTDFFDQVYAVFADPSVWETYPEAAGVLEDLRRRGLRLAIVSNFDARLLPVCEGLGLTAAVDAIVIAAEVGVAKPGAGIFHAAVQRFGLSPSAALHVGDSLSEDAEGALSAGLLAVHLQRDGDDGSGALPPGVKVIRDLRELPAMTGV
ncbi:HAD-IA family hydrolase [Thioalkalivibrio sp.]|uniref:HAD-IA family hydrolase n=1 Tax=Thioalkalivibrio sp. TaxID=2093813 RepID=UPI0012D69EFD|nr:HAD-IA family hydrolase [Thioalkalivibrio sp.]TVP79433.1 MAG: HAD family hydrolase [Thioalkalivibrio sp.]